MKIIIGLLYLLSIAFGANSQNYNQTYNKLLDRMEFYNSNGSMVGYAVQNTLLNRLEYFDAEGNQIKNLQYNNLLNRNETYDSHGEFLGYSKYNSLLNQQEAYNKNGEKQYAKKWNSLLNRYDYIDPNGELLGYYNYNSLLQKWEFFSHSQPNSTAGNYSNTTSSYSTPLYENDWDRLYDNMEKMNAKVRNLIASGYVYDPVTQRWVTQSDYQKKVSAREGMIRRAEKNQKSVFKDGEYLVTYFSTNYPSAPVFDGKAYVKKGCVRKIDAGVGKLRLKRKCNVSTGKGYATAVFFTPNGLATSEITIIVGDEVN